jgi:hypothetical protein
MTLAPSGDFWEGTWVSTAAGVSQTEKAGGDTFLISYLQHTGAGPQGQQEFCLGVTTQQFAYSPVQSGCDGWLPAFDGLAQLTPEQVPHEAFAP